MRKQTAIFLLLLLSICMMSCSIKQRVKRADKKFAIGEYYEAADIYKSVYPRVSKKDRALKAHVAFRQGECYLILNNTRAAAAYQNAIRMHYTDSIVYLHHAQALHYQGKYKEAEKSYLMYLESHPDDYVAKAGVYACRQVAEWKKKPSRYKVVAAKDFNQKRSSNFAPAFIGENADALMFTSNRQQTKSSKKLRRPSPVTGQQTFTLYTTRKNAAGQWEGIETPDGLYGDSETEQETAENDSIGQSRSGSAELGVCSFTSDGRTMYFTFSRPMNGQDQGAKIFTSSRASGQWSEAQEVILFRDSSISVGHPAINPTGDTLYFVSDAPGGYGGKDIYMAELDGSEWGNIQNLGPQINTSADELFPYVHADGSLYFASNGHPGYGGLDIFHAVRDTTQRTNITTETPPYLEKEDEQPEPCIISTISWNIFNMGAPFNSTGDDFGITFAGRSQNGFFSSNRGQKKGFDLIYSFVLPEMVFLVQGAITDNNGERISDAVVRLIGDDGTNTKLTARRDGTYKIKLNKDARYTMLATARGHLNQTTSFNTHNLADSHTYTKDFVLTPISKPVSMDNIFYEYGKWNLTPESETGLQTLVKLLNDNPNITIELSAHTDMRGDSVFNVNLSQKRAQSVVDYLVQHGIEKERLTPVGYGKQRPVVADKELHNKYKFIPIGQVLDEAFILSLKTEQQEICNQINRRTEFKVLRTTYKLY